MKILVTGSAGFLGSHLCNKLTSLGHSVVGWDIAEDKDVCDPYLTIQGIGALFHLACPVDPANYKKVSLSTALASSIGTYNMLKIAERNKALFLYVSSSDIYGHPKEKIFSEDTWSYTDHLGERSYYTESKKFGEMLTMIYHRYYNLNVRIIRPFNIYGPGMRADDSRVIPSMLRRKYNKLPLEVTGDGSATRTFCYVDDFTEALIRAMFYKNTNGEVFNIGTTESVTMLKLSRMISKKIIYTSLRVGEQVHRMPDISKAKKILSWEPTTDLKTGLELTWKSYQ